MSIELMHAESTINGYIDMVMEMLSSDINPNKLPQKDIDMMKTLLDICKFVYVAKVSVETTARSAGIDPDESRK